MRFDTLERDRRPRRSVADALGALAADENRNATMHALCEAFPTPRAGRAPASVPFSSARKWSAATFGDRGTWVLGAPEMVWVDRPADDPVRVRVRAPRGRRSTGAAARARPTPRSTARRCPSALERVRARAVRRADPRRRGRDAPVLRRAGRARAWSISGDSPRTVGAVAARVGIAGAERPVDGRELPDDARRARRRCSRTSRCSAG